MKTIRDAIHGDMRFDAGELRVLDTPPMQRLRGVKQLGAANLVYPSAVHTRFEHSLGVCWLAKKILDGLTERGAAISPTERRAAALAALLHDVTHLPFGHTFEDERRLFDRHDRDQSRLATFLAQPDLAAALAASGVEAETRAMLAGGGPRPFLAQAVSGTVGADLLDYLRRDARFCGLTLDYDDRLLQHFRVVDGVLAVCLHKGGALRRDVLSELIQLLQLRYALTERVYYHHAKVVAGAMVSRALELALKCGFRKEQLYALRDDSFLDRLTLAAGGGEGDAETRQGLRDLLDDLDRRRLFLRVYVLTMAAFGRPGLAPPQRDELARRFHADLAGRAAAEAAIAGRIGVPPAHVVLYCPSPAVQRKEADVPVEIAPGRVRPLSALGHPDVDALSEKHRGLWRLYVLLRQDHRALAAAAGKACEGVLGPANQQAVLRQGLLEFRE